MRNLIFFSLFLFSCQSQQPVTQSSGTKEALNPCPIDYSNYLKCYEKKFNYFIERYQKDIKEMSSEGGSSFKKMVASAVSSHCSRENMLKKKLDELSGNNKDQCAKEIEIAEVDLLDNLLKKEIN